MPTIEKWILEHTSLTCLAIRDPNASKLYYVERSVRMAVIRGMREAAGHQCYECSKDDIPKLALYDGRTNIWYHKKAQCKAQRIQDKIQQLEQELEHVE